VRAVTQNRRMADSVGVPTGKVDMLAFGLGSGIAGLGGVALSQIGNVGPELGQGYIVDSFMVVVLGGGPAGRDRDRAMGLGIVNKFWNRGWGRCWPRSSSSASSSLHPEASARPVRPQGPGTD
jgi:branched-subunit amino acid ABC-type transport system permease component